MSSQNSTQNDDRVGDTLDIEVEMMRRNPEFKITINGFRMVSMVMVIMVMVKIVIIRVIHAILNTVIGIS